jgi:GNAT superfamily N-acetyltransferase
MSESRIIAKSFMPKPSVTIRPAQSHSDAQQLLHLIERLAQYESLSAPDTAAKARFISDGFERVSPRFSAVLAMIDGESEPCGYAIYFDTYSTFLCKPSLYIEDIFVLPEARRSGVGYAILRYLAEIAKTNGYGRIEWTCLDWNVDAQRFYGKIGARHLSEWLFYRMDEKAIESFVGSDEH